VAGLGMLVAAIIAVQTLGPRNGGVVASDNFEI